MVSAVWSIQVRENKYKERNIILEYSLKKFGIGKVDYWRRLSVQMCYTSYWLHSNQSITCMLVIGSDKDNLKDSSSELYSCVNLLET